MAIHFLAAPVVFQISSFLNPLYPEKGLSLNPFQCEIKRGNKKQILCFY